ncbi:hypothetical protein [Cohaesibacter celericrescens]|uniref:Uncharacterized protein n=1 Tax=Cohaesibacter celericrescens TaxID=2067669 RepID=A0A2N5XMS2_9HYPH|nr:hypothetical protein [Cohaesibacter celericrescens]PLW75717.1 hypothetical protein C0081_18945 [Cohaesibacter celericrescens]
MKKIATALSVIAISAIASTTFASAAQHVDSHSLTGSQVKQLVQEQGSVLLDTGPNLFDRYVANGSYCTLLGEHAEPAYVPTANSSSEFVGYTCQANHDNS